MLKFEKDSVFYTQGYDKDLCEKAFEAVKEECDSDRIGYYKLPQTSQDIIAKLKEYEKQNSFLKEAKNIVVIGIGGSSLGAKAVDSMLNHKNKSGKNLYFFENSDPIDITKTLNKLNKEDTLFIVISKSGGTIETTSIFKTAIDHFNIDLNSDDTKRLIAITDNGSSLSKFADEYGIKEFNLPLNVGGRFSVLSSVGIIPLYLAGYDVDGLLSGAGSLVDSFFAKNEEHLLQKAYQLFKDWDKNSINVVFAYSNALEDFTKWYVQLWGESLGKIDKDGKNVGLTPIGIVGSVDQHSFLQLIIEGPRDKTVTFLNVENFENDLVIPNVSLKNIEKTDFINGKKFEELINAQCDATMQSVKDVDVPADKITLTTLDEKTCGELIMYYEILTSLVGVMLNINTYDQPGVELGKIILSKKFGL